MAVQQIFNDRIELLIVLFTILLNLRELIIPTNSKEHAEIIKNVLDVDQELKPESCKKEISVLESELIM